MSSEQITQITQLISQLLFLAYYIYRKFTKNGV